MKIFVTLFLALSLSAAAKANDRSNLSPDAQAERLKVYFIIINDTYVVDETLIEVVHGVHLPRTPDGYKWKAIRNSAQSFALTDYLGMPYDRSQTAKIENDVTVYRLIKNKPNLPNSFKMERVQYISAKDKTEAMQILRIQGFFELQGYYDRLNLEQREENIHTNNMCGNFLK